MRLDVYGKVSIIVKDEIKPNFAAIAREMGCDYRTAKRHYEQSLLTQSGKQVAHAPTTQRVSILEEYKPLIQDKVERFNASAMSILKFIQKRGYTGQYGLIKRFCGQFREEQIHKATIRVEHTPGLSAQIDWKEDLRMVNSDGEEFKFNIYLYVLPYSKLKYMTLTYDRSQDTILECLNNAFKATGGVPEEIWCDNAKTLINHAKSNFGHAVFNERFWRFAKDAGLNPIACRPFRPQTKDCVEALSRTTKRLAPYNMEFTAREELITLVNDLNDELNHEVSQATDEVPQDKWLYQEKEYLHSVAENLLRPYFSNDIHRIVTKEAMVNFRKSRYSVNPRYIGRTVDIEVSNDEQSIHIYYNGEKISKHVLSAKRLNYHPNDMMEILKSDLLSDYSNDEIREYVKRHLQEYDQL